MAFLDRILDPPSYGYLRAQKLYVPTHRELWREFFSRLSPSRFPKNWLPLFGWLEILFFLPFFILSFTEFFTWKLALLGFVYSMVLMGAHGTVYLHRYSTHHAFVFSNRWWLFLVRELTIKVVPEETYVVSHHVHHYLSEKPGDPYNAKAGWLYCFLADVNHQSISRELSPEDYAKTASLIRHTGIRINSYAQYQKWGSISNPYFTVLHYALNWGFWFAAFYLLGGMALAVTLFGWAGVWAVGIRTFNYEGHGRGRDRRKEGSDFNRADFSINQPWPGMITGEWHNNHHLYPNGARAGFLPHQWDFAWLFIRLIHGLGGIPSYRDYKEQFLEKYHRPYLALKKAQAEVH